MFSNFDLRTFRFDTNLLILTLLFISGTVLPAQPPTTWTCCRTATTSKRVCDSLAAFRIPVRAASLATDTVNDLALLKLCRSRLSDDLLRQILDTLKTYQVTDRIQFLRDIHGISNLPTATVPNNARSMSQFVSNLTMNHVRAWQWCNTVRPVRPMPSTDQMRLDWNVLESIVNAINNPLALNALFMNNEDKYLRVLRTFRGNCNTCDSSITDPKHNLPTIATYLDTLLAFTVKYALPIKVAGFDIFLQQEASATWLTKPDGAYHLMRDLAKTSYLRTSVLEFEGTISSRMPIPAGGYQCTDCSYDLRLNNDTLVDYKSYGVNTGFTVKTTNQFRQYLQYWLPNAVINDSTAVPIRNFQYVFNGDKLDSTIARRKFQNLIKGDSLGYFAINPAFFTRFTYRPIGGVPVRVSRANLSAFLDAIDTRHALFNFVITKP